MSLCSNTESMTPEERSEYISRLRRWGLGLLVAAIVGSMGLTAGLWSSMGGSNAMQIGIGAFGVLFIVGGAMLKIGNKMAANSNNDRDRTKASASATAAAADAFTATAGDV